MAFMIEVWGDYALFTRPEMKVERVSYDVMTPSAARGLLEAIYWHPGIRWIIDRIYVLNPIQFTNIRRNEVSAKLSAKNARSVMTGGGGDLYLSTQENIQQRASMLLKDVRYVIEAHFEITEQASPDDNHGKITDIVHRRLQKGQCYHQPYLGTREFPASFREWTGKAPQTAYPDGQKDLGFMLYDMDYSDHENIKPQFFRAVLDSGVLNLTDCEVFT